MKRRDFIKETGIALIVAFVAPTVLAVKPSELITEGGMGTCDVNGNVGKNFERFTLVFPDKCFDENNLIVGPSNVPIRIISASYVDVGAGKWYYSCEIMTGNPDMFVPGEDMKPGTEYRKDWSLVEATLERPIKQWSDRKFFNIK